MADAGEDHEHQKDRDPGDRIHDSEEAIISALFLRGDSVFPGIFATPLKPHGGDHEQSYDRDDKASLEFAQTPESIGCE